MHLGAVRGGECPGEAGGLPCWRCECEYRAVQKALELDLRHCDYSPGSGPNLPWLWADWACMTSSAKGGIFETNLEVFFPAIDILWFLKNESKESSTPFHSICVSLADHWGLARASLQMRALAALWAGDDTSFSLWLWLSSYYNDSILFCPPFPTSCSSLVMGILPMSSWGGPENADIGGWSQVWNGFSKEGGGRAEIINAISQLLKCPIIIA